MSVTFYSIRLSQSCPFLLENLSYVRGIQTGPSATRNAIAFEFRTNDSNPEREQRERERARDLTDDEGDRDDRRDRDDGEERETEQGVMRGNVGPGSSVGGDHDGQDDRSDRQ